MPSIQFKVPSLVAADSTRLRSLLEKQGAVILRRNHLPDPFPDHLPEQLSDLSLQERLQISAVLAVDITRPPEPGGKEEEFAGSFAKGIEVWMGNESTGCRTYVDVDEVTPALAIFDAYARVARYEPAHARLEQGRIAISFRFREGLVLGIQGTEAGGEGRKRSGDDPRETAFALRLPQPAIEGIYRQLSGALEWLEANSYETVLGA